MLKKQKGAKKTDDRRKRVLSVLYKPSPGSDFLLWNSSEGGTHQT